MAGVVLGPAPWLIQTVLWRAFVVMMTMMMMMMCVCVHVGVLRRTSNTRKRNENEERNKEKVHGECRQADGREAASEAVEQ